MTGLGDLRDEVCEANRRLSISGLAPLTWGNVSGRSADGELVVIKPSGVAYDRMQPEHMVVLTVDGDVVDGDLRPSTDTPTHLELYRAFPNASGIVHAHSAHATAFAQARQPIACLGTTHADHFGGAVPVTRTLTAGEVADAYEQATGTVIVDHFHQEGIDPAVVPAVLVAGHGPFAWGPTVAKAVDNAIALEAVAQMAISTAAIADGNPPELEPWVLNVHHQRKHGTGAYYGQS